MVLHPDGVCCGSHLRVDHLEFCGVLQDTAAPLTDAFEGHTELACIIGTGELSFERVNELCEGWQDIQEGVFANKPGLCHSR